MKAIIVVLLLAGCGSLDGPLVSKDYCNNVNLAAPAFDPARYSHAPIIIVEQR